MKVAVVGASGMVGRVMLRLLEERNFPLTELLLVASARSVGKEIDFKGKSYTFISVEDAIAAAPDVALFSAGGDASREYAPKFVEQGTVVIDNSSAWRMDDRYPLVIPEINANKLTSSDKLIANPNCSTIQLLMAVAPLHKEFGIERMIISTYQSMTGTGVKAVEQYENERDGKSGDMAYPYPIYQNCLPQCDVFEDNDYTKEEMKLVRESRKILDEPNLQVTATAVRVPVLGGHSESVNITFEKDFDIEKVKDILRSTDGVVLQDNPAKLDYPMPLSAKDKDEVFVGRVRRDESAPRSLNLWVVADNLRKGAATNAIQIAESMLQAGLIQ
ncbi:MAG: aspartate-semialdehyde dehydrogenase [Flavobacteriales bacterium]|nr:aspartate-semialdehyde dehydrogenase [Flavobacteriales bacterium]